ncbi:hypothetical protein ID853_05980 [Xenorhabdus sp. Vera]|uniref:hypothetical protein n=1 Tax=Xenorhabdus koppenhoeferi TaxID=351659 RepID=UPI0019949874|nr:hypothetical protein [Xenorhabdus sp. Vera]MBD2810442.1 hypothetical protein [Xenorhabdus sp. Vera]
MKPTNSPKEAGVKFGRKPHKSTAEANKMIAQKISMKEVMKKTGISRATYFRLKKMI